VDGNYLIVQWITEGPSFDQVAPSCCFHVKY